MKNLLKVMTIGLLFIAIGCDLKSDKDEDTITQGLEVISISPLEYSTINATTEFTVAIEYNLKSDPSYASNKQYAIEALIDLSSSVGQLTSSIVSGEKGAATLRFTIGDMFFASTKAPYKISFILSNNTDNYLFSETQKYLFN